MSEHLSPEALRELIAQHIQNCVECQTRSVLIRDHALRALEA